MKSIYQVIRSPRQTEKGTLQQQNENKYLFVVDRQANKLEIKKAVEDIYKVKVKSVNTAVVPGKLKRVRHQLGKTPDWKKAVVTLKEGKIELTQ